MSKKCVCGRDMVLRDWSHEWVCTRCGRKKPVEEKPFYTVFTCHKCGHVLYVKEDCDFPQKLERIGGMSCPDCGEQDEGLWGLLGRSDGFAEPIRVEWEENDHD